MDFKLAGYKDYERIASLHTHSWKMLYQDFLSPQYIDLDIMAERRVLWQTRLINPPFNQHVLMLEEGGLLCGFICAFGNHDFEKGTFIDALHVDPNYLKRGLGIKLISQLSQWVMKYFPNNGIYLHVIKNNNRAVRFCENLGGQLVQERIWTSPCGTQIPEAVYTWESAAGLFKSTIRHESRANCIPLS
ncbi:GNAT family N-acetyltransferase [Vibrio hepatarius]|uniref:GNAT family N-acetyltransferase n=1 Tax=Vibrio hepatarius TaxID=171383 RepID=UPI001C09DB9E|nr:GNAT family N-acetyltransferase [Vibrio hepatarius]MBU2895161.1 GNAT family N-acetyltransferase [Vibrio hepatarius]